MGYLRTIYVPNGNIKTPIDIYVCDGCKRKISEQYPNWKKENLIYCVDCAFKNKIINDRVYLENSGISLDTFHADVIDGEIIVWYGKIHPLDKRRDKLDRRCKAYKDWRKAVFFRDKYKCVKCDSKERLEAHHIKEFSKYKKLRFIVKNGETLCYKCHKQEHKKRGGTDE